MHEDSTQADLVCGVDLGGTNLRAANIDCDGQIHERVRIPTPGSKAATDLVSAIAAAVRKCEAKGSKQGAAVRTVSVVVSRISSGMANVVNIFNPEMIVVGGGVSAPWNLLAQPAREEVMKRAFPVPAQRCQVVRAECGDDAGLIGAASLAFGVR